MRRSLSTVLFINTSINSLLPTFASCSGVIMFQVTPMCSPVNIQVLSIDSILAHKVHQ